MRNGRQNFPPKMWQIGTSMYKNELVSDFYLSRYNSQPEDITTSSPLSNGSLALSARLYSDKKFVMCRNTSRTWWETAWQRKE